MSHAKLSPSGAKRWMRCPAAPKRESVFPDTSSDAAQWGTESHEILEKALVSGEPCATYAKDYSEGTEKARVAQIAVDYVERRQREIGSPVAVRAESRSDAGVHHGIDCLYGTADIVLVGDTVLEIGDLKTGRMNVDPDDPQLLIYAYGIYMEYVHPEDSVAPFDTIRMTIVQPRGDNPEHIRYIEYAPEELCDRFETEVLPAAKNALSDNPKAVATTTGCQWCKASATCPERAAFTMGMVGATSLAELSDAADTDTATLSVADLAEIQEAAPSIRKWLDNVSGALRDLLEQRDPEAREYYMLTPGRKTKSFNVEEEELVRKLQNTHKLKKGQIYKTTLNTPAALLKVEGLTQKQIEGVKKFIKEAPQGNTMVPRNPDKVDAMPLASNMAELVESTDTDSTESTDLLDFLS